MADFGVYTKNADIQARCGINANATAKATAATDIYVQSIEAYVNTATQYNWSGAFIGATGSEFIPLLTEAGACLCAINVIQQDPDAIGRSAAALMLNVLDDRATRAIKEIKDKDGRDIILGVKS